MRSAFALSLVAAFGLLVPLASGQNKDEQTATGKIILSRPTFKFEAGNIYEATAEGKDFQPSLQVNYSDLSTHYSFSTGPFDPTKRFVHRSFLMAKKTGDFPVLVTFPGIPSNDQPHEYKMSVRRIPMAKKALFEKEDKLTADDPIYPSRNSPHKAYPITLKAGKFYIIDMVRKKTNAFGGMDPYLYLEDTKPATEFQKIAASDDDSGGDLNARIFYQAPKDGDFVVIATSLNRTPGEFTITIRAQE